MAEQDSAHPPSWPRSRPRKHGRTGRGTTVSPWPRKTRQGIRRHPRLRVSGK